MKKAIDILFLARQEGVEIVLNGSDLNVRFPKNKSINNELIKGIRENKESIIEVLKDNGINADKSAKQITSFNRKDVLHIPLSFSQERLWFIHQLEGSHQYHLTNLLKLTGVVNIAALEYALKNIVQRHEVLRSVILETNGVPYQQVMSADDWNMPVIDAAEFKNDRAGLQNLVVKHADIPFDLAKDYMFRAALYVLGSTEHYLSITMHHIASDAWSMPVIVNEVVEFYKNFESGTLSDIPSLQLQFADYAVWERNYLNKDLLDTKLKYWKEKLKDVSALQLPTDFVRPSVRSIRGSTVSTSVDKQLARQLTQLASDRGCSLYMLLLTAFKILLFRNSNQNDICVGASIANRSQQDINNLVGFFVNTLAFRTSITAEGTFGELLQQEKITTLEAYQHQDVPFEKVVEAVLNERDPSRTPVFQVMLVLNNTPDVPEIKMGDLVISGVQYEMPVSKFDFTFFVSERKDGMQITVAYSTDLYRAETISGLLGQFTTLLQSIADNPNEKAGYLRLLSVEEETALLKKLTGPQLNSSKQNSVTGLFEEQVVKLPESIAVVFEGNQLSFQQLNEKANRLAHLIKRKTKGSNTYVPVFIERSMDTVVAILGIMKAGCAYVPIEVDLPVERIEYMLNDRGAAFVVSSSNCSEKLRSFDYIEIIELNDFSMELQPSSNLEEKVDPQQTAYVIYTSGSTGQPKGVMVNHANLVDYVAGLQHTINIKQCASYALVSSFATDLGNTVVFSSLLLGGALHIISKENVSNTSYLLNYFKTHSIDCLKIVPSHWKALSNEDELLLPAKFLIFGGEALRTATVESIVSTGASCTIVNHYGPTETTIGKLLHIVNPSANYNNTIPIGKPFSNTRVYVLSNEMQVCPQGVPGQLFIAGDGVAKGYLNNEKLTAEKFINDPFSKDGNSRMYATGDLVKCLSTGDIEFIGRVDDQVKIRGYRVELGEVENVLLQFEGIKLCAVKAIEDKNGFARLAAYVVSDSAFDRDAILDYLNARLPEYMVPGVIVSLDEMPLAINGKINKKALPDPDAEALLTGEYVAPRNPDEVLLTGIWQNILEVDKIGVNDDFFELGGHSLLAVRLISAIRKAFNVEIPISHVFDYPTVASLAGVLGTVTSANMLPPVEAISPRPEKIPLSFSQERLWFIDKMEGSINYHVPAVLRLQGTIDADALEFAFKSLVNRHEVLRTIFYEVDGEVYQRVKDKNNWKLALKDGTLFNNDQPALQHYIRELIDQPFDLAADDMLRAELVSLSNEEHILVITLHHIASDGWSRTILVREVAELYNVYHGNTPITLEPLTVQYADYALWQHKFITGELLEKKLQYWKEKLSNTVPIQFPSYSNRLNVKEKKSGEVEFKIDKSLLTSLNEMGQQQGTTLFMTLLAAFKVLLYKYVGQEDLCIGTPVAGRQHHEIEKLIGFFLNTLALRSVMDPQQSFSKFLQQVRTVTLEAFENQEVPFEKVVEAVVKTRDQHTSPLFQVMFMLQNTPDLKEIKLGDVRMSNERSGMESVKFEISMGLRETPDGLLGSIDYNAGLFSRLMMEQLASHYVHLLANIVQAPGKSIAALHVLRQSEQKILLEELNHTDTSFPRLTTIVEMFEQKADESPSAICLAILDKQYNYQQINRYANKYAGQLLQLGIEPGSLVPIYIDRSVEMVVGMLAIAKAGGSYVPLDPEYPGERIKYIVDDINADYIVTSEDLAHLFNEGDQIKTVSISLEDDSENFQNPAITQSAESIFCVVYTSGSSGKPKGVKLSNANILNRIFWMNDAFPFGNNECVAIKTSIGFVDHISELFAPLILGIPSVIFTKEDLLDPDTLFEKLSAYRISRWVLVPSLLKALIEKLKASPLDLSHLKYWTSSGETLNGDLVKDFYEVFPAAKHKLLNIYGSSEVTADVTCYDTSVDFVASINDENIAMTEASVYNVPIGKPIANCHVYIVDKNGNLAPRGCYGQICIGGAPVSKGYFNNDELNRQKFVRNTFESGAGDLFFKTGDFGRWLPDGNLEYAGRIDNQVKIRGNRVETGEIEQILLQSGTIKEVAVVAKEDKQGYKFLAAYVVAQSFDKQEAIKYLQAKLPAYMIPAAWIVVENLPLTPSGKIDKRALIAADFTAVNTNTYVAPRTDTERALSEIWQDLLKLEKVGVEDNFFELGGHSLLIVKMVSAIRRQFSLAVPIAVFFQFSTIAALANYIDWELGAVNEEDTESLEVFNL